MEAPQLDESSASEFIGKTILVGVTYLDRDDNVVARKDWSEIIRSYSNQDGIRIDLDDSAEPCCLPPDPNAIRKADPGVYRLRSSGKEVVDPDFTTVWTRKQP